MRPEQEGITTGPSPLEPHVAQAVERGKPTLRGINMSATADREVDAVLLAPPDEDMLEGFASPTREDTQRAFLLAIEHEKPIERFNTSAGLVLASTYESFPSDHGFTVDYQANEQLAILVKDTIKWLAHEGYIRMDQHGSNHFRATLTAKGLAALTTTPSSLSPAKDTIGETMLKEAKKGGKDAMAALAKEALVAGVRLLGNAAMQHAGVHLGS